MKRVELVGMDELIWTVWTWGCSVCGSIFIGFGFLFANLGFVRYDIHLFLYIAASFFAIGICCAIITIFLIRGQR